MRVDATSSSLTALTTAAAGPAQGDITLSFEQLLDQAATQDVVGQQRAFGFSELGVVRPDAAPEPAEDTLSNNASNFTPDNAESSTRTAVPGYLELIGAAANPQEPLEAHSSASAAPPVRELRLQSNSARVYPARASQASVIAPPPTRLMPAQQAETSSRKAPVRGTPQPASEKRVNLVVSVNDGVVQIIVGAPQLSSEARARLRKAAVKLAAEFGLSLGELIMNGVPIDAPSIDTGA